MTQKVFNLIILDESGSMEVIKEQAISGVNETLQTIRTAQKEHPEQQHFITLVTFNSARIHKAMDNTPIDITRDMKWNDYSPDSCTPLFDAMGDSLCELEKYVKQEDVVLVTIITDGMENASQRYTGIDIKRIVSRLREKGWVFAYIGTNQDVDAVADRLGIHSRMNYNYSPTGAACMFATERRSKKAFFDKLSSFGKSIVMDKNYDYFGNDEKEPDIVWDLNKNKE